MSSEHEVFLGECKIETYDVHALMERVSMEDLDDLDKQDLLSGVERRITDLLREGQTKEEIMGTMENETEQLDPDVIKFLMDQASWCLNYMEA